MLSTAASISTKRSIVGRVYRYDGLLTVICYIVLFFGSSRFYSFSRVHIKAVIISSAIISIYGILQYFGIDPIPIDPIRANWQGYVYSTIGNPNFLSSYLVLLLPINVAYFIYSESIPGLINSCVLFTVLILTKTRSGWVGFIFSFVLLVYFLLKKRDRNIVKNIIITALLFFIIAFSINTLSKNAYSQRFQSIFKDSRIVINHERLYEYAGSSRIFIWKRVIKLIEKRPLLGYGPDTLDIVFMNEYKYELPKFFKALTVDKSHNEFLQIAFNSGIPALCLYVLFVFLLLYRVFKNYTKNILIPPLICSVSGYIIQSFFNISVVSTAPIYWIFLGILYGIRDSHFNYELFK
jgi:putative inorganic carbon (HCO3(-)) transporter